ncbi:MAG: zinc finger Ran-binding domain-containing protein [Firmicutes bacterium]|nr:zinc finger Ran-binding domain-containing protein [Bacillota bacterium]
MAENTTENFLLLDTVNDYVARKIDMFSFIAKIEQFREALSQFQIQTSETMDHLCANAALAEASVMEVEQINQAFDAYYETFDMLKEFVLSNDFNNIILMGSRISQCSSALDAAVNAFAEKALILRGPTKFAKLNHIIDCCKQIEVRNEGFERLSAAVTAEKESFLSNIEFLEKKAQSDKLPEIEALLETYREAIKVLEAVDTASQEKNVPVIQQEIEKLDGFYIRANGLNMELLMKFLAGSHTFLPEANCLIAASIDYREGRVIETVLLETYDVFREKLASIEEQIISFTSESEENGEDNSWKEYFSDDEREEMAGFTAKMSEALEPIKDSLVYYERFIDELNPDLLKKGDEALKESLRALEEPARQMAEAGEKVGKVQCIKCGTLNPKERKTCSQCSAVLLEGGL